MNCEEAERLYQAALASLRSYQNAYENAAGELAEADRAPRDHDVHQRLVARYGPGYRKMIEKGLEAARSEFRKAEGRVHEAQRVLDSVCNN